MRILLEPAVDAPSVHAYVGSDGSKVSVMSAEVFGQVADGPFAFDMPRDDKGGVTGWPTHVR
jgi:hypothetical protein